MSLDLSIASKAFGDFMKIVKEHGFVRIIPLLTIDNIVAASILAKMFMENDVAVSISLKPVVDRDDPTIVIDIPFDHNVCGRYCFEILYDGGLKDVEIRNGNILSTPHSISATIVKIIEDYWILSGNEKVICLLGGINRGKDLSREGFIKLEKAIVEELSKSNKIFYDVVGFRLWGWKRRKLYEILTYTITPFIPGLTGRKETAIEFIKKLGFEDPDKVHSSDLVTKEDVLKNFATELIKTANEKSKKRRSPLEFISRIYFLSRGADFIDLMELYGAVLTAFSKGGDYLVNNFLIAQDSTLIDRLLIFYEKHIDAISSDVANAIDGLYEDTNNRVVVEPSIVSRPEVFEMVLSEIGLVDDTKYVVVNTGGKYYTSLLSLIKIKKKIDYESFDEEQLLYIE